MLSPIGNRSVQEGEQLSFLLSAIDPQGDSVNFTVSDNPSGSLLDGSTFSWIPSFEQAGGYNATFMVDDGNGNTDIEHITITVENKNRTPVFESIGDKEILAETLLEFVLSATDPDGDSFSFAVSVIPNGATLQDNIFSWTPSFSQIGSFPVTFTVLDENDEGTTEDITILVNTPPEGPISIDFNPSDGDQEKRLAKGGKPGRIYELQLNVADVPEINGWNAIIKYDPIQLAYVDGSFKASAFITGLLALADSKEGELAVGGTVLGTDAQNSGDGTLGTVSFQLLDSFSEETEIAIIEINLRRVDKVPNKETVLHLVKITDEPDLVGDFDSNGKVDFDDFFIFADGFGGTDPRYDLDESGAVDFDDFFIFADNFGKEALPKLLALAQEYLGLPVAPGLDQNYPNPFNSSTTIRYRIVQRESVHLNVFDLAGQRIKSLVNEAQAPGSYEIMWDGTNEDGISVSSGLYFTKLEVGEFAEVRKMMLMK